MANEKEENTGLSCTYKCTKNSRHSGSVERPFDAYSTFLGDGDALMVSKIAGWLPASHKVHRRCETPLDRLEQVHRVFTDIEGIPFNDYSDFPIALGVHLAWLFLLILLFKRRIL